MTSRGRAHRDGNSNSQPARRQPNACLKCHQKKVKCDMDSAGQPCTGCATIGVECKKRTRKPYPPRKDTSAASSITPEPSVSAISSNADMIPTPPRSIPSDTLRTPVFNGEPFNLASNYMDTPQIQSHGTLPTFMSAPPTANMAVPSIAPSKDVVIAGPMPFYSDDQQRYSYVLDICGAEKIDAATNQHHLIPQATANSMDHEDLAYAEAKGCFSIPSHQICEDLITAYFHYVHPMLPIIDQAEFLKHYSERSFQNLSLVLLWSMFSVGASFSSDATLSMAGCKSRQELKKVMYGRAKCLHETGYEQDKITLIQSSLLLGFWYADLLDRAKSWHWTGVAISMAQTIGLHRDPGSRHFNSTISSSHRRVWANIWWSCFFRDRWLSFGYGRPLRINADDCDVPMPTSDCMMELPEQCPPAWRKYAPQELSQAAPIWLKLLELTQVLGDVMTSCYQPRRSALDANSVEILEQRILDAQPEKQSLVATSELLLFFEAYTRLHVESALISLYRPFTSTPFTSLNVSDTTLSAIANTKIRSAATRANGTLDWIISTDTLKYAGPMMVPLLVPAMTIHLLESKSNDPFTRSWSKNRLDLCLLVLKRLEDNYPAAAMVHELFTHAKDKDTASSGTSTHSGSSKVDTPNPGNIMSWEGSNIEPQASVGSSLSGSTQTWPIPNASTSLPPDMWNTIFPEQLCFPLEDMHYWE